ncbi:hypothetical protein [Modestobacter sp. SSW1-42]|uniref:hypothetical protein n=1 Tax=Modestobacter sp. SSW1-42 TaxID=596372 RepID=UPI003988934C
MSKWTVVAGVAWVVLSVLAFTVDPILGAVVLIFGAAAVVVVQLASSWDQHPDFEARELARSRRRQAKWERTAPSREKDAARFAAHQARQAARRGEQTRQADTPS